MNFLKEASSRASQLRQQFQQSSGSVLEKISGATQAALGPRITEEIPELRQQLDELSRLDTITTHNKAFIKDTIRAEENVAAAGARYTEAHLRMVETLQTFALDNQSANTALAIACMQYSSARTQIESDREVLYRKVNDEFLEPLRNYLLTSQLEEARHLFKRYEKLRLDVDGAASQVKQRREKVGNSDPEGKLQQLEAKQKEAVQVMTAQGEEAAHAQRVVAMEQTRETLLKMITLVELERDHAARTASALDRLYSQLLAERGKPSDKVERTESFSTRTTSPPPPPPPPAYEEVQKPLERQQSNVTRNASPGGGMGDLLGADLGGSSATTRTTSPPSQSTPSLPHMLAEVVHDFSAEDAGELSVRRGDFVVIRQVTDGGWADGQCKNKAGWLPRSHVKIIRNV